MTLALASSMQQNPQKRTLARLSAVQALYQQSIAEQSGDEAVNDFFSHHFETRMGDVSLASIDQELFLDLAKGAANRLSDIDRMIEQNLAEGWSVERLDSVLRAILRVAIYELWCRADIPPAVTIGEYVGIAHDFYEGTEPKFINSVLDKLARTLRGDGAMKPVGSR